MFTDKGTDLRTVSEAFSHLSHTDQLTLSKSLKKDGLVQKQVTVQGKHGTYTQMKWVKASDDKTTKTAQPAKAAGNHKDTVKQLRTTHGADKVMSAAKAAGLTWKENTNPGINFMRCSMALAAHPDKLSAVAASLGGQSAPKTATTKAAQPVQPSKAAVKTLADTHGRDKLMEAAKAVGITWKENANKGINYMRAAQAIAAADQSTIDQITAKLQSRKTVTPTQPAPKAQPAISADVTMKITAAIAEATQKIGDKYGSVAVRIGQASGESGTSGNVQQSGSPAAPKVELKVDKAMEKQLTEAALKAGFTAVEFKTTSSTTSTKQVNGNTRKKTVKQRIAYFHKAQPDPASTQPQNTYVYPTDPVAAADELSTVLKTYDHGKIASYLTGLGEGTKIRIGGKGGNIYTRKNGVWNDTANDFGDSALGAMLETQVNSRNKSLQVAPATDPLKDAVRELKDINSLTHPHNLLYAVKLGLDRQVSSLEDAIQSAAIQGKLDERDKLSDEQDKLMSNQAMFSRTLAKLMGVDVKQPSDALQFKPSNRQLNFQVESEGQPTDTTQSITFTPSANQPYIDTYDMDAFNAVIQQNGLPIIRDKVSDAISNVELVKDDNTGRYNLRLTVDVSNVKGTTPAATPVVPATTLVTVAPPPKAQSTTSSSVFSSGQTHSTTSHEKLNNLLDDWATVGVQPLIQQILDAVDTAQTNHLVDASKSTIIGRIQDDLDAAGVDSNSFKVASITCNKSTADVTLRVKPKKAMTNMQKSSVGTLWSLFIKPVLASYCKQKGAALSQSVVEGSGDSVDLSFTLKNYKPTPKDDKPTPNGMGGVVYRGKSIHKKNGIKGASVTVPDSYQVDGKTFTTQQEALAYVDGVTHTDSNPAYGWVNDTYYAKRMVPSAMIPLNAIRNIKTKLGKSPTVADVKKLYEEYTPKVEAAYKQLSNATSRQGFTVLNTNYTKLQQEQRVLKELMSDLDTSRPAGKTGDSWKVDLSKLP